MNDQDKNIAVLAAHMEHVVKSMDEMRADMKAIPDKIATQYVSKEEYSAFKNDFNDFRADLKKFMDRIEEQALSYASKEDGKAYVTREQFKPYQVILGLIGTAVMLGIIQAAIRFFYPSV